MTIENKIRFLTQDPLVCRVASAAASAAMLVLSVLLALSVAFLQGCEDSSDGSDDTYTESGFTDGPDDAGETDAPDLDPERVNPEGDGCEPPPPPPEPDLSRCWETERVFFTVLPGKNRIGWPDWECLRSGIEIADCYFHVSTARPGKIRFQCTFECGLYREAEIEWPEPPGITEIALHNPCLLDGDPPLSIEVPEGDATVPADYGASRFGVSL